MSDIVHVAVAVIMNERNEVCISLRDKDAHQGGLWEFPGGKLEQGETVEQALIREVKEELTLVIEQSRPVITITHDYPDKTVCLYVRKTLSYQGQAVGVEGQQVKWVPVSQLSDYDFPAANLSIIKVLQLPDKYLITGKWLDNDDFINKLKKALNHDIKLVQLRLKNDSKKDMSQMQSLFENVAILCKQANTKLMLNAADNYLDIIDLTNIDFEGFHADSRTLMSLSRRPKGRLFSASCHSEEELVKAAQLQADFVVLSPVQKTASHPEMPAMGWQQFAAMLEHIAIPVYALGGLTEKDMKVARQHGAQGIAAISAFWND